MGLRRRARMQPSTITWKPAVVPCTQPVKSSTKPPTKLPNPVRSDHEPTPQNSWRDQLQAFRDRLIKR
jgi:hypothetical protein